MDDRFSSVKRKPLSHLEDAAEPLVVLVTGGTGYIGSRVVERLLAGGHTVRVACLPSELDNPNALSFLKDLPGASQRLTFFAANVLERGACSQPMAGCDALIHLAAIVSMHSGDPGTNAAMIRIALQGTRNVLDAVEDSPSVRGVLMLSSLAAVVGDWYERGCAYTYSEKDWVTDCSDRHNVYNFSKRNSEQLAYELCAQQSRWRLVTLNPGVVLGPAPTARHLQYSASANFLYTLVSGRAWPLVPDAHIPFADVDDVAFAAMSALLQPSVTGRHLVVSCVVSAPRVAAALREWYPHLWLPVMIVRGWAAVALIWLLGKYVHSDVKTLRCTLSKSLWVDASKVQRSLGLQYTEIERTLRDMTEQMMALGLAPRGPRRKEE